jgi:hypothetical protein
MASIPLSDLRASTVARFLHEDPHTPATDDVTDFEHALSGEGLDSYVDSIHPAWRRQLFALLERPESSLPAFAIHGERYISSHTIQCPQIW